MCISFSVVPLILIESIGFKVTRPFVRCSHSRNSRNTQWGQTSHNSKHHHITVIMLASSPLPAATGSGSGSSFGGFPSARSFTPAQSVLARLQLCVEIIEKEYEEFNVHHAARQSKKHIPQLFYSFYHTQLCTNFIMACYEYLQQFAKQPIEGGQPLHLNKGPLATTARGTARSNNGELKPIDSSRSHLPTPPPHPRGAARPSAHVLELQARMQTVAACWSAILLYRSDMNRAETITISGSMKRSQHFLSDFYDQSFFETLYLLVEYVLEFTFMDQTRQQQQPSHSPASGTKTPSTPTTLMSPSSGGPLSPQNSSLVAASSPKASSKASTASAQAIAASVEANWRVIQHELQRILRSRNFHASMKKQPPDASNHHRLSNGLNHIPLGNTANSAAPPQRKHRSTGSMSYRNAATFKPPPRNWNDDDQRAISHLPGRVRSGFGILECLDLRSPLVASLLPNVRSMRHENDLYVFGAERPAHSEQHRFGGRLTHAEEVYLTRTHALQAKREAEWKARLVREEKEERDREEEEERRRILNELSLEQDASASLPQISDAAASLNGNADQTPPSLVIPPLQLRGFHQPVPPSASAPASSRPLPLRQSSISSQLSSTERDPFASTQQTISGELTATAGSGGNQWFQYAETKNMEQPISYEMYSALKSGGPDRALSAPATARPPTARTIQIRHSNAQLLSLFNNQLVAEIK